MSPAPSPHAARVAVKALAAAGVRDYVLAPGSRSAPLVYALADAARSERPTGAPDVEVHVRVDEREAAFLALGIAKAAAASGSPRAVAVVTTSGTAVANLLPAVLEAHHSGVSLLLLTADRPRALRGTGSNQTTVQPGLLEPAVRLTLDLEAHDGLREAMTFAARAALDPADPGPVHVNLAFDEPLVPGDEPWPLDPGPLDPGPLSDDASGFLGTARSQGKVLLGLGVPLAHETSRAGAPALPDGPPTAVVAGDGAGGQALELAAARRWPLLAEPTSGARGGPCAVPAYRLLLDAWPTAQDVRRVVVVGRPTLSRPVARLLARDDVEVVRVQRPAAAWPAAGGSADVLVPEVPRSWLDTTAPPDTGWLASWLAAGEAALRFVRESSDSPSSGGRAMPRLTGPALADLVARASRPEDVLVVGSSNPVRDLDLVADWDEAPLVVANRGLSGIDGMVSTITGVGLALPDRVVRAVVGDLTFLHGIGGLLGGTLERAAHAQIVVANDDGGSVFATLEHGAPERAEVFERFFATPHGADLAALCAGYGVRHRVARDAVEVAAELASPGPGLSVLEVRVDRARRRELDAGLLALDLP